MAIFKVQRNELTKNWDVFAETTEGRCVIGHVDEEILAHMFAAALEDTLHHVGLEPQVAADRIQEAV
jgi:hypothetical protein